MLRIIKHNINININHKIKSMNKINPNKTEKLNKNAQIIMHHRDTTSNTEGGRVNSKYYKVWVIIK